MRANRVILHGIVVVLVVLMLAPFLWLVRMSFQTSAEVFAFPPHLFIAPTLANYAALWEGVSASRSFFWRAGISGCWIRGWAAYLFDVCRRWNRG